MPAHGGLRWGLSNAIVWLNKPYGHYGGHSDRHDGYSDRHDGGGSHHDTRARAHRHAFRRERLRYGVAADPDAAGRRERGEH